MGYKLIDIYNWNGIHNKEQLLTLINSIKNKDIIPPNTLIHMNIKQIGIQNIPITYHRVTFSGRELPIIIFSYGFIYLGKETRKEKWKIWELLEEPKDEWKVIWFENITDGTIENDSVTLNEKKEFKFTPYEDKSKDNSENNSENKSNKFTTFKDGLHDAFKDYIDIADDTNKELFKRLYDSIPKSLGKPLGIRGGRRKTKRSKRSKHSRRNKKCKRRTCRS
jgi:hypothetical protein